MNMISCNWQYWWWR